MSLGNYNANLLTDDDYIELQYKHVSEQEWKTEHQYRKDALSDFATKRLDLSFGTLPTGTYMLRAKTYCSADNSSSYSDIVTGIADRDLFLMVENNLSDGWLRDTKVRIDFNQDVGQARCYLENAFL